MPEDRAVSPVIGVILVVAITVIIAAVVGTFVLDLGQNVQNVSPQATFSVDTDVDENNVSIEHEGGTALQDDSTEVLIQNESSGERIFLDPGSSSTRFRVGDVLVVDALNDSVQATVSGDSDVWQDRSAAEATAFEIVQGTEHSVTIIHTESESRVFETTVTA